MDNRGTVYVKFVPQFDSDTIMKNGVSKVIHVNHQFISAMKEYERKSFEELRFEDYMFNRKKSGQEYRFVRKLRFEDYGFNNKKPHQKSGGLFAFPSGSPNSLSTGNWNHFDCNKPSFGSINVFDSAAEKSTFRNTNTFSSMENKPLFGNTSKFGSMEYKPPFGNTSRFDSIENKPLFGNTSKFVSMKYKPPFGNTSRFGCIENKPPFGNTSKFGSIEEKPPFGNTSKFGSVEDKPPFGNTSKFGSVEDKPPFGNTSKFGTVEDKPHFGNSRKFVTIENKPRFGNTSVFGAAKSAVGNTSSFSAAAQSLPDTQSSSDMNFYSNSTENTNSKMNSNFKFENKNRTLRKMAKRYFKSHSKAEISSVSSSSSKTSHDGEVVLFGEIEKFNFNFGNLKIKVPQGELSFQNSLSENYEEGLKALVSNLHGLIECPICFGNLDSSLRQCENGHGICGSCFNNVEKCPTCQHAYLPYKPILLWKILEHMPKLCSFADKGCDKIFFNKKEEHESFCKFRPTSCKFQSCEWKGTVESVIEHVKNCKESTENSFCKMYFSNVKVNQIYVFKKEEEVSFYSAIIFEDQLFWKHFQRDNNSKIISHRFYHIAPFKPQQKYYLVVSFNKGEIGFKTCAAASYESDSEDKKINEISFVVPDEDLERFYDSKAKGYLYTQQIIVEDINCDEKKQD